METVAFLRNLEGEIAILSADSHAKDSVSLKAAVTVARNLEKALKKAGVIEATEGERVGFELDRLYPLARSKQIVTFKNQKYMRKFMPREKNKQGKVIEWEKTWVSLVD